MVIINSILLLILDFYIYKGLKSTRIAFFKTKWFARLWWGYSFLLIAGVFLGIYFNIPLMFRSILLVVFFMTFTTKFIYTLVLFFDDLRRGGVWLKRLFFKQPKTDSSPFAEETPLPEKPIKGISRSDFLLKAGMAVAAVPLLPLSWGVISGAYDYRIRRQKLYLPNLPSSFHGLKIAQISDIHSGSFYNKTAVLGGVEMLLGEKPDMVFFTGDLVNNVAEELKDYKDIFSKVKAPLGVFSVLGNHDYGDYFYGKEPSAAKAQNLIDLKNAHGQMGWQLLNNAHEMVQIGQDQIAIVGVENWGTGRFPKHGDLTRALEGTQEAPVKLLLSHDPSHWRAQVLQHADIDVTFSGHTHGMQFGVRTETLRWSPVQYLYKEWAGLYREGSQQLYVNTGFGFLGYPGRVGILPEITIFELVKGTAPVA
jgi:predicted MPP superfamily phosphohydrolase